MPPRSLPAHRRSGRTGPRRRGVVGAVALALPLALSAATLLPAASASAGSDQVYVLPRSGKFTVDGHGFGHGHGMSQYGAEGAARQGIGYRSILRFYYPGTELQSATPRIRVRIDEDTTDDVQVLPRPGLAVKDRGTGAVYELPERSDIERWRLNVSHGHAVIAYRTDRWHRYRFGDGEQFLEGEGQFQAHGYLTLVLPHGVEMPVHGILRAAVPEPGSNDRDTVNALGLEQYLRGVVAAEMPASWHQAALRAQSVAARTYALFERAAYQHRYYQICDTSACQVYRGMEGQYASTDRAIRATRGRYLSYQGEPAFTQFSSSSGGWTSAGSVPYLAHQRDPYDNWPGNGVHAWSQRLDESVLEKAYPGHGDLKRIRVTRREGGGQWHGRVEQLVLEFGRGDVTISGDEFRAVTGLRSTWFALRT